MSAVSGAVPAPPAYGTRSLADLLPSMAAALGVPGFDDNPLGLPAVSRTCLVIVDGLGAPLLTRYAADAPFLSGLRFGPPLTAGFPATTATSMASLGTGTPPGVHGMLGYRVRSPETGELLNLLRWDDHHTPEDWQPLPTMFERLTDAGWPTFHAGPPEFANSPLTRAVWRGGQYAPAFTAGDLVAATAASVAAEPRSLTVAYHGDLDRVGHIRGCGSPAWRHQLALTDLMVARLAATLPPDALLLVTGDHGMVDVPDAGRVDVDTVPELREGVLLMGGEARARHVYTRPGAVGDVRDAWQEVLGDRAWVAGRDEAVAAGWFGPTVRPQLLPRIGDLVVAAAPGSAVVATTTEPMESMLVGVHGSLDPADGEVPLLAARAGRRLD